MIFKLRASLLKCQHKKAKMSHIYLIRHGQASFGSENYDRLSDLGQRQARVIGEYFAAQGIKIARIIHGEMSRQQQTAEILAERSGFSGDLICHIGANEFDSDYLVKHYLPILAQQSLELAEILKKDGKWWSSDDNFELYFCALVDLWQSDENCPFESWQDFKSRCLECLNDVSTINNGAPNEGITILSTSGGLISVIMQSILKFDNKSFMDMNLTTNNASISEIIWPAKTANLTTIPIKNTPIKKRNRLLSFNNITPLLLAKDAKLITRK